VWDEPASGDIGDFLFARIADDEREARRDRYAEPWLVGPFSAARVITEAELKRRLVKEHGPADYPAGRCVTCGHDDVSSPNQAQPYPCASMRLLALAHRAHRDYNPDWAI
jgi:hypothetical protein